MPCKLEIELRPLFNSNGGGTTADMMLDGLRVIARRVDEVTAILLSEDDGLPVDLESKLKRGFHAGDPVLDPCGKVAEEVEQHVADLTDMQNVVQDTAREASDVLEGLVLEIDQLKRDQSCLQTTTRSALDDLCAALKELRQDQKAVFDDISRQIANLDQRLMGRSRQ